MSEIFFTSDTHFGHARIIKFCNRPFGTVEEMDEMMITKWNAKVKPEDSVYHLGDFTFKGKTRGKEIRQRLNGKIHLILGNHDTGDDYGFEWMKQYYELEVDHQEIVLFHYGLRTWHHDLRGVWHLYGHSHMGLPAYGKSFDIGVDSWNFFPLSFQEVMWQMDRRDIGPHPHFENFTLEQKGENPV